MVVTTLERRLTVTSPNRRPARVVHSSLIRPALPPRHCRLDDTRRLPMLRG
jgi:hypothetical protein